MLCDTIFGYCLKAAGYTFKGGNSVNFIFAPFRKGVYSKRKEFAPSGRKFFPFRVDFSPQAFSLMLYGLKEIFLLRVSLLGRSLGLYTSQQK